MDTRAVIATSLQQHVHIVRTYPAAVLMVVSSGVIALYFGHADHRLGQAVAYLCAVWFCAFLVDVVVNSRPRRAVGFPIKYGAAREAVVILTCTLLGLVFLFVRFASGQWNAMLPIHRLLWMPLLLFTYPIILALIYLLHYRYTPGEIGANLHYWYLPLLLHPVWGAITLTAAPDRVHWRSFIHENGIIGLVWTGLISSALCEEFTRTLLQTRLGLALHNKGLGFVAATFIWASLHIPVNLSSDPNASVWQVVIGSWGLMPIGLLWGYLTHRSKSLFPAVFMHGLNLWGLQNL
jgi:membrane protease YdiL (CAAX protease family)